jgi:ribosomal protein L29
MKIDAMIEWSAEERAAKEKEWRQALFTLKLQKATGQLDNPMKLREVRKDIARLKTLEHMDAARAAAQKAHAEHEAAAHAAGEGAAPGAAPAAAAGSKKGAPKKAAPKAARKAAPKAAKKAAPKAAKKAAPAKKSAAAGAKKSKGK